MGHRASQRRLGGEGLVSWRQRYLERAGFDARLAAQLARDRRVDVHALLELLDRGCPPELAARILAPLDDGAELTE
jgi:Glu-tRNA(Gln) amidotransferase subunit E-like FAD-binding protein